MGLIGVMEWCGAWEQVPGEGEALGQGLKVPLPTATPDQQRAPLCKGCSGSTSRKREQMPQLGWAPVGTPREAQSKGWAVDGPTEALRGRGVCLLGPQEPTAEQPLSCHPPAKQLCGPCRP